MIEQPEPTAPPTVTKPPLVSIIAPCYNAEKFLEAAIESIFAQDYENFEVIIVDDGSTDDSYAMLEALQSKYSFQLYRQANQGVSATLNHGLQYAKGTYVATPDLDDIMLPESVRVRAEYLDQHPQLGCVGALIIYMDCDGNETKRQSRDYIEHLDFEKVLSEAVVVGAPVALYRLEAVKAAGLYNPQIKVQDFQMTLKIAHQGYGIDVLPTCVTLYRRHANNLSRRYKVLLDADLQTIEPYRSYPGYQSGRTYIINKALKYAVVSDKAYAWKLIRSIPLRHMTSKTLRRFKRLVLHW